MLRLGLGYGWRVFEEWLLSEVEIPAFAARGLEGTVRRGDGAQHNREAEKGDSREPGANAFPVGIGVACAA